MPRRTRLAAHLVLLSLPLLTACGASPPLVTEAPRLTIPDSLKACQPQPEPPAAGADDTALATWIVDLAEAGADCRGKLAAVVKVIGP